MAIRNLTTTAFRKYLDQAVEASDKELYRSLIGWSPGYAAGYLGISRQNVHKAVKTGNLDAVIVRDRGGRIEQFYILDESLKAYKAARERRLANTG